MKYLLLAVCLIPAAAHAEGGRTAAPFLTRPAGARGFALGQAFTAVGGGLDSLGYNPAGLAGVKKRAVSATAANGFAEDTFGFLGYAQATPIGTFAAGVLYYDGGNINLNLTSGPGGSKKAEQDAAYMFSYAAEPLPGLSVGGTFKYVQLMLVEKYKADTQAFDAGAIWKTPVAGLSLGGAWQHIGSDVTFEQDGDPLPRTLRAGAAYLIEFGESVEAAGPRSEEFRVVETAADWEESQSGPSRLSLLATADVVQQLRLDAQTRVGLELRSAPSRAPDTYTAFRVGYAFNRDVDALSVGFGWNGRHLSVDYGLGLVKDLNSQHRLTVGYRF